MENQIKELIKQSLPEVLKSDFIETITQSDDPGTLTKRIEVLFKNGLSLSIIQGPFTYGGMEGLVEIAVIDKKGKLVDSFFEEEDQGDTVCGHCDEEKVKYYLNKIGKISCKK